MSDKPEGSGAPPLATRTEHTAECDLLFAQFASYMTDRGERYAAWNSPRGCGCETEQPRAAPLEPLADLPEKEK